MQIAKGAITIYGLYVSIQRGSKKRTLASDTRSEIDFLGIRRPCKLIHPIFKLRQQILDCLCRPVVNHQPELIALVAGARLGAPRQVFSVGRVGGVEVAAERSAHLHRTGRRIGHGRC